MALNIFHERKLGIAEKVIWLIDRESRFSFLTHVEVCGEVPDSLLRKALDTVQLRHPLLRARIVRKKWSNAYFDFTDVAPIGLRFISAPKNNWLKEAEFELQSPFPISDGPLCRCVLIRHEANSSTLILSFHHAIGDAMSGVYMARDLILTLSCLLNKKEPCLPHLPITQAMEYYFPNWAKSFRGIFKNQLFLLYLILNRLRFGKPFLPKHEQWVPPSQRIPHIASRTLDPDFVNTLIHQARMRQTTVHGALSSAFIIALAEDENLNECQSFFLGSDIDLRGNLVPPIGDDIGFFISGILTISRAGQSSNFWELAQQIRSLIMKRIESGDHFTGAHGLIRVTNFLYSLFGTGKLASRIYANHIDRTNPGMIVLSNVGDVSFNQDFTPLKIKTLGFASSFSCTSTLGLHVATLNGILTMNFVAMKPLYFNEKIQRIAERMIFILKQNVVK